MVVLNILGSANPNHNTDPNPNYNHNPYAFKQNIPVNRLIMLAKNNAELTFEPHSAPPKCILWDVFWVFPSLPRFPAYMAGTRWKILLRSVKLRSDWYDTVSVIHV